jgi:hypothetical protein
MIKLLTIMLALLFALTMPVFASESTHQNNISSVPAENQTWTAQKDVPSNKVWSIKFNAPVLESTVNNQNIYVVDNDGQRHNVKVSLTMDKKTILVTPLENYKLGANYTLNILKTVASDSPQSITLKNNISMQFTITDITVISIDEIYVDYIVGTDLELPPTVTAAMSDGSTKTVNVTWDSFDPAIISKFEPGDFTLNGTITESTTIKVTAIITTVIPQPIIYVADINMEINQGGSYSLPTMVDVLTQIGPTISNVVWDPLNIDTSKVGTYTFTGKVRGYGKKITLTLKINEIPATAVVNSASIDNDTITVTLSNPIAGDIKPGDPDPILPTYGDFSLTVSNKVIIPIVSSYMTGAVVTLKIPKPIVSNMADQEYNVSYKGGEPVVAYIQAKSTGPNNVKVGQYFNIVVNEGDSPEGIWSYTPDNNQAIKLIQEIGGFTSYLPGGGWLEILTFQITEPGIFNVQFSNMVGDKVDYIINSYES